MSQPWRPRTFSLHLASLLACVLVACAGAGALAVWRLHDLQAAFETDARIVHRLLSQRVVQHDAVMATLALLQPPATGASGGAGATGASGGAVTSGSADALPRLPAVYPQILSVLQRPPGAQWPADVQADLAAAEVASQRSGHAEMALLNASAGRYYLVMAGRPASHALLIDLRATVPSDEWPMDMATSPVRVTLDHGGQSFVVQPGGIDPRGWGREYGFHKVLAAASQPFDVVARRSVGLHELPWWSMLGWCVLTAALWAAALALHRQRIARQRAEELLRLGQVARLNTLGELAAGMAHELNQPLTALLSGTQAAQRLLAEDPPDLATAQTAMARAVEQARRASAVVGRLRRLVERADPAGQTQPLALPAAISDVLHLLEPELAARGIAPEVTAAADLPPVLADPVALQQIVHNLLMNALQALEQVPPTERRLRIGMARTDAGSVALSIRDHGPGIPAEQRLHVFEPFHTTREGGLGLGLTLCESLAQAMGAQLVLAPLPAHPAAQDRGAEFVLTMPVAAASAG